MKLPNLILLALTLTTVNPDCILSTGNTNSGGTFFTHTENFFTTSAGIPFATTKASYIGRPDMTYAVSFGKPCGASYTVTVHATSISANACNESWSWVAAGVWESGTSVLLNSSGAGNSRVD